MTKLEKMIEKMRNNPKGDWRIEDLKKLADRLGVEYRQKGTSHVVFKFRDNTAYPIPAKRPIRPIYVTKFLEILDDLYD